MYGELIKGRPVGLARRSSLATAEQQPQQGMTAPQVEERVQVATRALETDFAARVHHLESLQVLSLPLPLSTAAHNSHVAIEYLLQTL